MAKKLKDESPAEVVPPHPRAVLVGEGVVAIADEPYALRDPEIHIAGAPYVHVDDAPDGAWIYAPRNAAHR